MKEESLKSKQIVSVLLFVLLYLFMALASLFKLVFLSTQKFGQAAFLGYIAICISLLLLLFVYATYCFMTRSSYLIHQPRILALICTTIAIGYVASIFLDHISVYLMPIFLTAFLLAPLIRRKDTFMAGLVSILCIMITLLLEYITLSKEDITPIILMGVMGIFSGTLVAFSLSYERKRLDFLIKGLAICLGSIVLVLVMSYPSLNYHADDGVSPDKAYLFVEVGKWITIAVMSQLIFTLILQPAFERIFNLLTNSRLLELTDHNSPLVARLMEEAPGTFNHSLAVASFAEVCATAIGENPYLARACAYYHDIGKLINPPYFKENQSKENPHDNVLPEVSVEIIRGHTFEGYKLCKQHHIPEEIARVTVEHHGTMPITMFYQKARELTDSDVDIKEFSYNGETPTTKIAAIIMICDAAEAALRAMDAPDSLKAEKLLSSLIWARIKSGQFDECDITLKQLSTIQSTIASSFGGVYHKRLKYPENNND